MLGKVTKSIRSEKYKNCNLDKLWEGIREEDSEALSRLYSRSYPWLFKYGYQIVPRGVFVEDAIQEQFLIFWDKRNTINKAHSVKAYLISSLRRLIFRRLKRQRNRTKRNNKYDRHLTKKKDSKEDKIINFEMSQEKEKQLNDAMAVLSDRQKEAIYLKFYDGLTAPEIAQIMEINKQSVYNHVSEGIDNMRKVVCSFWQGRQL